MNFEQRMRTALKEGADGLSFPEAGPDAARERAHQRARRRQAGTGGVTALAVVAAGITGWQLLPDERVRFDPDGGAVADGGGDASNPLADLEWRDAEGVVGGNKEILYSTEDGTYYALSTAPGTDSADHPDGAYPQALYRSADGLSWEPAELGEKPWIADLGERGGVLYAVSTAPTTSGTGSGRIGVSTDGGQTWSQEDLPSTATPPDAAVELHGPSVTAAIAVGEDVLLARTTTTYRIADDAVFSAEEITDEHDVQETDEGQRYVRQTDEGLALMEMGCEHAPERAPDPSADEAEIAAAEAAAEEERLPEPMPAGACSGDGEQVVRTVPWSDLGLDSRADLRVDELFRSTDGETWEPIDASAFAGRYVQELTAGPQGFFAIIHPQTNTDGVAPSAELLRSADGLTWEQVDPMGYVRTLGFVGERIVGTTSYDERDLAAVTSDDGGATWTRTDLAELVDPESKAQHVGLHTQATGPLGAAIVAAVYTDGGPELHLLTSGDGVAWSVTPLTDVVGDDPPTSVSWIAVGEDSIALTASWLVNGEELSRTRTFVGTPTR